MTRLLAMPVPPPAPASVVLSELALAAGQAGRSITVCFDGFAAPLLCELFKRFVEQIASSRVHHVTSQSDVRKLAKHTVRPRLIIVHQPRLHNATTWAIEMAAPADDATSRPTVFCRFAPQAPEEDPGATITLRANPEETARLRQWLVSGSLQNVDSVDFAVTEPVGTVQELLPLLSSCRVAHGAGASRFREQKILHGLLVGAAVLRAARGECPADVPLTSTLQDYEVIRALLQSPVVGPADESFDPLAVAMVNRSNVYLLAKSRSGMDFPEALGGVDLVSSRRGDRPPRELITRREIADLGNLGSRVLRRLVALMAGWPDGHQHFVRMGLASRPPARDRWSEQTQEHLTRLLRSWTAKQVRLHFGGLQRLGLVSAERHPTNGPWCYRLPEELASRSNGFRRLPTVAELTPATRSQ